MKVFEILGPAAISEEALIKRLKTFDWKYEFSDDIGRINRGNRDLDLLENAMYEFWKKSPERAIELWNTYSPVGKPGVIPSFIFRMESQELV